RNDITAHINHCPDCRQCLSQIQNDNAPRLPPLPVRIKTRLRHRLANFWSFAALATACALAIFLFSSQNFRSHTFSLRSSSKGFGQIMTLVRARAGAIEEDPKTFTQEDRFKVLVTCPAGSGTLWQLVVFQDQEVSFPLGPPQASACGNREPMDG